MAHHGRVRKKSSMTSKQPSESGKSVDSTQTQSTSLSGGSHSKEPQAKDRQGGSLIDSYEGPWPECSWRTGEECFEWWVNHEEE